MKPGRIALILLLFGFIALTEPVFAAYTISPGSLVMGIGGKVRIENLGTEFFSNSTTVAMDGVSFAVSLISSKIIEIDIPARRHWYGPKRLTIVNGAGNILIDGQFKIDEFNPVGSKNIMFDFEGGTIEGNATYHEISSTPYTVEKEGGHGSNFSFKQTIVNSAGNNATRWWISRGTTAFPGRGVYIPEAAGMNRLTYDVKAPTGFAGEVNIGTYHSDPDFFLDGNYTNPESNNWHFYVVQYLTSPNNTWKTNYEPLFYSAQRQSGGCCADVGLMGNGSTEPVGHRRGNISGATSVVWKRGGKTLTVGSFDVLTRLYIDHPDEDNTGYAGQPIWFDNIGFVSVDDFVEATPSWSIRDAGIDIFVDFPFSFTNEKNETRNFYVVSEFVSSITDRHKYFTSPEGVYEDTNKNGIIDSGELRLNETPIKFLKLDQALSPNETRYFILRMKSSSATGDFKTGLVHFHESDVADADSVYATSTRYSNLTAINKKADGAYRTFTFHVNTPATLPSNTISMPSNISVSTVGNDTWIVWDEVSEANNGTLAGYEIHKGNTPSTFQHFRNITAASPGYIDLGENTPGVYRVRALSTLGTSSAWATLISPPQGVRVD